MHKLSRPTASCVVDVGAHDLLVHLHAAAALRCTNHWHKLCSGRDRKTYIGDILRRYLCSHAVHDCFLVFYMLGLPFRHFLLASSCTAFLLSYLSSPSTSRLLSGKAVLEDRFRLVVVTIGLGMGVNLETTSWRRDNNLRPYVRMVTSSCRVFAKC